MPHCIVEYSKDLENLVTPKQILDAVYQANLRSGLFEDQDIKTRALAFEHYQAGALQQAFIHVTVKILSGRDLLQRNNLSHLVLEQLAQINLGPISITVEVIEIEKESYAKRVVSN